MTYSKNNYPNSMKNLAEEIREKAIEIANTLIKEEKMEESTAIPIAISRAKDWAVNRGLKVKPSDTDNKTHGQDQYVIPHQNGWAVKSESSERVSFTFSNKKEAVEKGKALAKKHRTSLTVQKANGQIQNKYSYNNV